MVQNFLIQFFFEWPKKPSGHFYPKNLQNLLTFTRNAPITSCPNLLITPPFCIDFLLDNGSAVFHPCPVCNFLRLFCAHSWVVKVFRITLYEDKFFAKSLIICWWLLMFERKWRLFVFWRFWKDKNEGKFDAIIRNKTRFLLVGFFECAC